MTSSNFHVCYASVASALFEHIEQDLLLLTTALLDDDEGAPRTEACAPALLPQWNLPS
ncbi:hypothetical protein [Massilia niastensis]|uniref:hypothetical protein n=1 Tax=Massilia niastensis TaxID=544911 RepID=UPI00037F8D90|nr:hypothetical protein [Massilia niastensis]